MTSEDQSRPRAAYRAYLVRLWRDSQEGPWRALARDAETAAEHRFATIEQLCLFLYRETRVEGQGKEGG